MTNNAQISSITLHYCQHFINSKTEMTVITFCGDKIKRTLASASLSSSSFLRLLTDRLMTPYDKPSCICIRHTINYMKQHLCVKFFRPSQGAEENYRKFSTFKSLLSFTVGTSHCYLSTRKVVKMT